MKHLIVILTLAAGLALFLAAQPVAAQDDDHGRESSEAVLRGAAIYATYCQACHGPTGEAIGSGPAFVAIKYDHDTARETILAGAGIMPAYDDVLAEAELDHLVAYMATWESGETPPLPKPTLHTVPDAVPDYFGDPHEGAVVYASFCAGCHGPDGQGRDAFDSPAIDLAGNTIELVAHEHEPAFGEAAGGPLSEDQLTDLETYLASWAMQPEDQPERSGLNLLIVFMGAAAILAVGAAYFTRGTEKGPEKIV